MRAAVSSHQINKRRTDTFGETQLARGPLTLLGANFLTLVTFGEIEKFIYLAFYLRGSAATAEEKIILHTHTHELDSGPFMIC